MNFAFAPREIRIASADGATTTLNINAARIENVAKTYSHDAYTDSVADVVRYIQELNDGVIYTPMQSTAMEYIDTGYRPDSIHFHDCDPAEPYWYWKPSYAAAFGALYGHCTLGVAATVEDTPEDDELTGVEELI